MERETGSETHRAVPHGFVLDKETGACKVCNLAIDAIIHRAHREEAAMNEGTERELGS